MKKITLSFLLILGCLCGFAQTVLVEFIQEPYEGKQAKLIIRQIGHPASTQLLKTEEAKKELLIALDDLLYQGFEVESSHTANISTGPTPSLYEQYVLSRAGKREDVDVD